MTIENRSIVIFAAGEMALVTVGAVAWKWPLVAELTHFDGSPEARRVLGQLLVIAFCPVWLTAGWLVAQRRLLTAIPRPSEDYRRWTEVSLVASGLALLIMQAWTARNFIAEDSLGRVALLRAITLFLGALTAAQGNYLAKAAPPSVADAAARGAWTRIAMRMGWAMALTGLAVIVGSLVLDLPTLFLVPVVAFLALLANAVLHRRALKMASLV